LLNFQSFTEKPVFDCAFGYPMILFYRIWLKTVSMASLKEHEKKRWETPGGRNRLRWLNKRHPRLGEAMVSASVSTGS